VNVTNVALIVALVINEPLLRKQGILFKYDSALFSFCNFSFVLCRDTCSTKADDRVEL